MWPSPIADRKAAWLVLTFQPAAPFTICCVLLKPGRVKGFGKGLISDRMMNTWCVVILKHDACTSCSHRRRGLSGWYALNCCPLLCPHGDMALDIHHSLMLLWFTRTPKINRLVDSVSQFLGSSTRSWINQELIWQDTERQIYHEILFSIFIWPTAANPYYDEGKYRNCHPSALLISRWRW